MPYYSVILTSVDRDARELLRQFPGDVMGSTNKGQLAVIPVAADRTEALETLLKATPSVTEWHRLRNLEQ